MSEESCELVLLGGSEFCNRKGETVFKFKRKTYDGQTYYLFETHYDRMEPTDISKFDLVFGIIKKVASDFDIPFYDSAELNEKLKKALDEYIKNHGVDELIREQKDFDIPLIDVATGDLKKLTVGIQLTKNYKP